MNVLPLVSAFILLFAIGSYAFVHSVRATIQEKFHYTGALAVERAFASKVQDDVYAEQKGEEPDSTPTTPSKKNINKVFESPRDKMNPHINRKLNIRGLLVGQGNPQLEKVVLTLLRDIYQNTTIYTPNMEREVLDVILSTLKVNPKVNSFEELLAKLPEHNIPHFYKLIKGTQQYELKTDVGYPALGDFLSINGKSPRDKPIHFYTASRPVLSALFGEKLTEQIMIEENRKWDIDHKESHLIKQELEAFLVKHKRNLSEFEPLIDFKTIQAEKRSQEVIQGSNTKLKIRITS